MPKREKFCGIARWDFLSAGVVIRSRFQRYIGQFVLHCHILPHEDRGMMLLVEIKS